MLCPSTNITSFDGSEIQASNHPTRPIKVYSIRRLSADDHLIGELMRDLTDNPFWADGNDGIPAGVHEAKHEIRGFEDLVRNAGVGEIVVSNTIDKAYFAQANVWEIPGQASSFTGDSKRKKGKK
ncbi:hypothetical protein FS837_008375 [Tulasnella sp. UAMH 9824]|nr:hypothetical protein FS837_008375 [Tulasnella sp. UAMH 9824]